MVSGVFDASINEVRSQSMHRVGLHKGLSTTFTRGPVTQKVSLSVGSQWVTDMGWLSTACMPDVAS